MSGKSLVSTVTIFLDAEEFLREAIESVFAQTYPSWELLLVDDGSTDGSSEIARRYASRFPNRVRYLEHDGHLNRGMSTSRNLGITRSVGEYVALLDADDVWLPGKLEHQLGILEANPEVAMVYGPGEWWYSWTGRFEDKDRDFVHHLGVESDSLIKPPTLLTRFLADEGISPCPSSMLARRELFDRVGGFVDSFRGLYEDQAFFAKVALETTVYASAGCWFRYRQHDTSAMSVAGRTGRRRDARLAFLKWLADYIEEPRFSDAGLSETLDRELRNARRSGAQGLPGRLVSLIPGIRVSRRA